MLVKIRLKLADDVPFHPLGVRANVIKIDVNFRHVERRKITDRHLRAPQDAATYKRDDQHEGYDGSPDGESEGIHRTNSTHDLCQARSKLDIEPNKHTRSRRAALSARMTCGEQPAAGEPGLSPAGRPLTARPKGVRFRQQRSGCCAGVRTERETPCGGVICERVREGGETSRTPGSPHGSSSAS